MNIGREIYDKIVDLLTNRKRAYQLAFGSPAGQAVLMDLAPFCRAAESCVVAVKGLPIDRDRTMILLGRNEVWLKIQNHLNLKPEQLYAIYDGRPVIATGDQNG